MDNKEKKSEWWIPGITVFVKMSGWVAGPIIAALFIGKYLDERFNTKPWLFLSSLVMAFIISSIAIVREALKLMNDIEKENSHESTDKHN